MTPFYPRACVPPESASSISFSWHHARSAVLVSACSNSYHCWSTPRSARTIFRRERMMNEWLPYVGVVTGIVGMITGVTGACLGYLGYRRSGRVKALDLRLELRKTETATRAILEQLPALINRAQASRTSAHVSGGSFGSSNQAAWVQECEKVRADVDGLLKELPATGDDYRTLSPEELESRLVAIDVLQAKASRIRDKCHGTIVADEKWRESLQATQYR